MLYLWQSVEHRRKRTGCNSRVKNRVGKSASHPCKNEHTSTKSRQHTNYRRRRLLCRLARRLLRRDDSLGCRQQFHGRVIEIEPGIIVHNEVHNMRRFADADGGNGLSFQQVKMTVNSDSAESLPEK